MAHDPKRDKVKCFIGGTSWPKTLNVMLSHSLQDKLYGPNRDRKMSKNSKMGKRDSVTFLVRSTSCPKTWRRDDVTFLTGSILWPRLYIKKRVRA